MKRVFLLIMVVMTPLLLCSMSESDQHTSNIAFIFDAFTAHVRHVSDDAQDNYSLQSSFSNRDDDNTPITDEHESTYKLHDVGYYETGNSEYKPYEDYWMITDTTSKAYQFLNSSDVQINSEGYLIYQDEYYCVALGHYFGDIGDKFLITLDSGFQFKVIIGDMKSHLHTDELRYAHQNGHIVEFIIDSNHPYMQSINIKYHGLINVADSKFQGSIINIERIEEIK